MKILVTGGNGFIGSHVVDNLLKKGHKVTVFDRRSYSPKLWSNVNYILGDIKDKEAVMEAVSTNDGVIHLAGVLGTSEAVTTAEESVNANIMGALNIYEAVKKHNKPAVTITVGNYTWNNTYAITKYTAERFALMYNKEFGTKIAVVRGLNVYGERQKHAPVKKVVPNFTLSALRNEPIEIYGDGEQLMDLIYAADTAEVLTRALLLDHGNYNSVFEAGSGAPVTVNDLANMIIKFAKSKSEIKYLPMRAGEPKRSITLGDPSTLESLAIRTQDLTPLEEGIRKTVIWYKKFYLPQLVSSKIAILARKNNK
ncbi:MAG: Nucleoside-diphosphate-sugar epimerase [Candidatus Daviesbacteria bacterium GW2011_GWA1_36_8]|uniref:Nucleoside-diphosphate-sugar epimerase n=1 Tax=Candidatus Daviesbacteria bacterium GW2011_GWA1_36_8 TaxID=1618417 RepID=A0A0G0FJA4_9BACT|nr:MAG: Nucleoside-diphosphate-sugar epimerase [Candidatus Daviesbacteria bacterium GW2011_GWA1_36_8]